jgi:hypothetical protein
MANIPIDYSVAGRWATHVRALAQIESGENEFAHGDDGRAFGLLQMHPARYMDEARFAGPFRIEVTDTWATAQIRAAAAYFERMADKPVELVVQAWNLGVHAVFDDGQNNVKYYARWLAAFDRLVPGGEVHPPRPEWR